MTNGSTFLWLIAACLVTVSAGMAQEPISSQTLNERLALDQEEADRLWGDFSAVSLVARVQVESVEETSRVVNLVEYLANAKVIEPFKGSAEKGKTLQYYFIAESGFPANSFCGDHVVFLKRIRSSMTGKPVLSALENSTRLSSKPFLDKLRSYRQESRAKPAR